MILLQTERAGFEFCVTVTEGDFLFLLQIFDMWPALFGTLPFFPPCLPFFFFLQAYGAAKGRESSRVRFSQFTQQEPVSVCVLYTYTRTCRMIETQYSSKILFKKEKGKPFTRKRFIESQIKINLSAMTGGYLFSEKCITCSKSSIIPHLDRDEPSRPIFRSCLRAAMAGLRLFSPQQWVHSRFSFFADDEN